MSDARRRPSPLRDAGAALSLLTLLPVDVSWSEGGRPRPVGYFPWVGWLLGIAGALVAFGPGRLAAPSGVGPYLAGTATVLGWAVVTRGLHWDGLADTVDGAWGAHDRERRLEIMSDSHIGAFGMTAIVLFALLQTAAVAACVARGAYWVVIVTPVLARAAASGACWVLPAAKPDGLGYGVVGRPGPYDSIVWASALAACAPLGVFAQTRGAFMLVLAVGLLGGIVVAWRLSRTVGGLTGDLLGATVLVTEALVLVVGAMVA